MNFAGWPFGLVYWPLQRALGTVWAWNVFVLLGFVGAGSFAALWLRELRVRRGAALVGGLAFCLAPYLVAQASAGHLLAWVSMLLALSLFAWERGLHRSPGWLALSAAALASIPLSGQVHVALGAIPFFLLYTLLRGRARPIAAGAALLAIGAGLLVYVAAIRDTVGAGGRSFAQVERYSAGAQGFVSRDVPSELERFVFLGWATPLLALVGLGLLLAARRFWLAAALGLGALVPMLLALGANLPGYETLWRNLPGLESTRVPARLMPVACLCLAALVAFAVTRVTWPGTAALVAIVLLLDLHVGLFENAPADEGNRGLRGPASRAAGESARDPRLPPRPPGSERLPLLDDAGPARAPVGLLDARSARGRPRAASPTARALHRPGGARRPLSRPARRRAHLRRPAPGARRRGFRLRAHIPIAW